MLALSVRQPYAELILAGLKTIEYRSRPTKLIGQRFHLYASRGKTPPIAIPTRTWSSDIAVPAGAAAPPPWIIELADALRLFPGDLPRGVIVGSAVIERVTPGDAALGSEGMWCWHLTGVRRAPRPRKPAGHPQPVWFRPF